MVYLILYMNLTIPYPALFQGIYISERGVNTHAVCQWDAYRIATAFKSTNPIFCAEGL